MRRKKIPDTTAYLDAIPHSQRIIIKYYHASGLSLSQALRIKKQHIDPQLVRIVFTKDEQMYLKNYMHWMKDDEYLYDPGVSRLIASERIRFHLQQMRKKAPNFKAKWRLGHPDVLIFGYPKCATTWFYHVTQDLPWFDVPVKEIEYFSSWRYALGEQWYRSHFMSKKISIDVSVGSMQRPEVWKRIRHYETKHKLKLKKILFLRKPSARALSFLRHRKAKGEGYYFFDRYLESGYVHQTFISSSEYKADLMQLLEYFSSKDFFVVFQEDVIKQPKLTLSRLCSFILQDEIDDSLLHRTLSKVSLDVDLNRSTQVHFFMLLKFAFEQEALWRLCNIRIFDYIGYGIRRLIQPFCISSIHVQREKYVRFVTQNLFLQRFDAEYKQLKSWLNKKHIRHS